MTPADYLRKVWHHEQAVRFCDYIALTLVDQLMPFLPPVNEQETAVLVDAERIGGANTTVAIVELLTTP